MTMTSRYEKRRGTGLPRTPRRRGAGHPAGRAAALLTEALGFTLLIGVIVIGLRAGFDATWKPLGLVGVAVGTGLVLKGQAGGRRR